MIKAKKQVLRTGIESLLLKEMAEDDNDFFVMGNDDDILDSIIPEEMPSGLFDNDESEDDIEAINIDDEDIDIY